MTKRQAQEGKKQSGGWGSVRRVDLVDHKGDDYAGDGDVEPEGKGPAGDGAVLVEFCEPGATEGDEDQGDDDDGEDGVGDEQSEIDGEKPALALEKDHLVDA